MDGFLISLWRTSLWIEFLDLFTLIFTSILRMINHKSFYKYLDLTMIFQDNHKDDALICVLCVYVNRWMMQFVFLNDDNNWRQTHKLPDQQNLLLILFPILWSIFSYTIFKGTGTSCRSLKRLKVKVHRTPKKRNKALKAKY